MAATPSGNGYWLVASDGGIFTFGDAVFYGSKGGQPLNKPIVGMAATPTGHGYWLVASDGGIFTFGDALFYGSTGGQPLNKPIVGMAATPTGHGYWLVAVRRRHLQPSATRPSTARPAASRSNKPIVGMAATASRPRLLAGRLRRRHLHLRRRVVLRLDRRTAARPAHRRHGPELHRATATGSSRRDGGIFTFGDAPFYGSMGGTTLDKPVVGMAGR